MASITAVSIAVLNGSLFCTTTFEATRFIARWHDGEYLGLTVEAKPAMAGFDFMTRSL